MGTREKPRPCTNSKGKHPKALKTKKVLTLAHDASILVLDAALKGGIGEDITLHSPALGIFRLGFSILSLGLDSRSSDNRCSHSARCLLNRGGDLGGNGLGATGTGNGRVSGGTGATGTLLRASDVGVLDEELLLIDSELDGGGGGHGTQVVHSGLETHLPAGEVHTGELAHGRLLQVDVEGLRLIDVGTAVGGHLQNVALGDLPDGLVQGLDVGGNVGDVLDGATIGDDAVLHVVGPQAEVDEVLQEPRVNDLELTSQDTAGVDVRGVGLEALVEAQNLTSTGSRHRSDQ